MTYTVAHPVGDAGRYQLTVTVADASGATTHPLISTDRYSEARHGFYALVAYAAIAAEGDGDLLAVDLIDTKEPHGQRTRRYPLPDTT